MKKPAILICISATILLALFIIAYPNIEITTEDKLFLCSYTNRFPEFDVNHTADENYCYNEKRNISVYNFSESHFLIFRVLTMNYVEGDMRQVEFLLNESYIENFLQNATIVSNDQNIDLGQMLEGRQAMEGNIRYPGNDYTHAIHYILDGREQVLYVFTLNDLLVIQVGHSDEGPKFIAYR